MAKDSKQTSAVDLISTLANADVDAIDAEIKEREAAIVKLQGEIVSLKLVKRSVDRFKNGPAKREPGKPRKKREATSPAPPPTPSSNSGNSKGANPTVLKIAAAIETLNGAALVPAIARETGYTSTLVSSVLNLNADRFVSAAGGVWKLKE